MKNYTNQIAQKIKKEWQDYEQLNLEKFKNSDIYKNLNDTSICIDCGANIGVISALLAEKGAFVYAFEPNPLCFKKLDYVAQKYPQIKVIKKGVLDKNCKIKLYHSDLTKEDPEFFSQSSSVCSTKDNINTNNFIKIDCIDLCEFIENLDKKIDILKLDVEGAEFCILEKLIEKNLHLKITSILVETHDATIPELLEVSSLVRKLIKEKDIKNINLDWV